MSHTGMPAVKICGITNTADAALALELGADFIGVILDKNVVRHGSPELISEIESIGGITCAVYTSMNQVMESPLGESIAQLHFPATEKDSSYLRERGIAVMGVAASTFQEIPEERANRLLHSDFKYVLLDYRDGAINHLEGIREFTGNQHIGIAGKISVEDLHCLLPLEPGLIDVSSSLEKSPGIKDHKKLRSFFESMEEFRDVTA